MDERAGKDPEFKNGLSLVFIDALGDTFWYRRFI